MDLFLNYKFIVHYLFSVVLRIFSLQQVQC